MTLTHYIVVRRDLPFGTTCAMVAHAAGESFYQLGRSSVKERGEGGNPVAAVGGSSPSAPANSDACTDPTCPRCKHLRRGSSEKERAILNREVAGLSPAPGSLDVQRTIAVILGARNEGKLQRLERQLLAAGIAHVAIREPAVPYDNQLMAIGLVPADGAALAAYVKDFHMLPEPV